MIVADAGPLIAFSRIGRLGLLGQVVGELVVPEAVYDDVGVKGKGRSGAEQVEHAHWIRRRGIADLGAAAPFPPDLGRGEREAIVLAKNERAHLLVDDRRARAVAQELGIEVFGTLRVLAEAKRRGFVAEVLPILQELRAVGYWIHEERVVRPFLREIGEEPM